MSLSLEPVRGGSVRRFRLALRLALRDIRKHRGRSALIVLLIALPIAAMSAGATLGLSTTSTPEETVRIELGQTQGRIGASPDGRTYAEQGVRGDLGSLNFRDDPVSTPIQLEAAVPAGYRTLPWHEGITRTPVDGVGMALSVIAADVLDPAFAGKYTLTEGRAPTAPGETVVSPGLLTRFELKLGDHLKTTVADVTIVGVVAAAEGYNQNSTLYLPGSTDMSSAIDGNSRIYLVGERALTWADALAMNEQGVILTSRELLLNPPSASVIGEDRAGLGDYRDEYLWTGLLLPMLLVGILALLEVGLLAGAAFAVGARAQRRSLALLSATGAESSTLRSLVTASGVWLGLAGGVLGALVGTGAAAITVMAVGDEWQFSGLHVFWSAAIALVVLGLIAGVLAALVPARTVARQSSMAALRAGQRAARPRALTAWVGGLLLGISALALAAACGLAVVFRDHPYTEIDWTTVVSITVLVSAVCLVVGLILLTGPLVRLLGRRTGWMPVPLRLAARDAVRNSSRTVPTIAAVLAAAMLSGAALVAVATTAHTEAENYNWEYNLNQAGIRLDYAESENGPSGETTVHTVDASTVRDAVGAALGDAATTHVLRGVPIDGNCVTTGSGPQDVCPRWQVAVPAGQACPLGSFDTAAAAEDWRCQGAMAEQTYTNSVPLIIVGDDTDLEEVLGRAPSAEASDTLARGGIVLSNPVFLADDAARIITIDENAPYVGDSSDIEELSGETLPAVVDAPTYPLSYYGVVSPETATRLGLPVADRVVLVDASRELSATEKDRLNAAAATSADPQGYVMVESGPSTILSAMLWLVVIAAAVITLSAAGITTGLALADGRDDHATLASIGASPGLRRSLAASQSMFTAVLGTALGLVAGAIPMTVMLATAPDSIIVIPWLQFGILLIAVPLCGAAAAWLFTRSRMPLTRRATLA